MDVTDDAPAALVDLLLELQPAEMNDTAITNIARDRGIVRDMTGLLERVH
jgi:hypothetical protein